MKTSGRCAESVVCEEVHTAVETRGSFPRQFPMLSPAEAVLVKVGQRIRSRLMLRLHGNHDGIC